MGGIDVWIHDFLISVLVYSRAKRPLYHSVGGWFGLRTILDDVEGRKFFLNLL
jgi:hypothetical protein